MGATRKTPIEIFKNIRWQVQFKKLYKFWILEKRNTLKNDLKLLSRPIVRRDKLGLEYSCPN